ncbi:hypothetical protein QOZ80_8BG0664560 [Eleusine coracana subsp. coracana]|nr:hypothetical protein QOZ80_8BG0664560 [Eleusine coracana subsp. coracana]
MVPAPPTNRKEATAAMEAPAGWNLPTDAFAEILLRLSLSSQRRVRLVCRHWRDVIDERFLPHHQSQPMPLIYARTGTSGSSAHVVEDLTDGRCCELWRSSGQYTLLVGTCNGLLCLCDNTKPGGAVSLVNPVTGEALAIPPLPSSGQWARQKRSWVEASNGWDKTYSFACRPVTGRYMLVHLPFHCDLTAGFNVLKVFTLGEDYSWRDVAVPGGATCRVDAGIVSVDGATYWVTKGAETVMSFDLEGETVVSTGPLPVPVGQGGYIFHLTEVNGKLGLAISADQPTPAKTEVWVLGVAKDRQAWVRWYGVQVHSVLQRLARPHFAHGKFVLTTDSKVERSWRSERKQVFAHRQRVAGRPLLSGEVRSVRIREPGTPVFGIANDCPGAVHGTFAYVATTEPLGEYIQGVKRRGRPLKT